MKTFYLYRKEDVSGVSGTGYVAEGVIFADGKVALSWLVDPGSINIYENIKECVEVHGHDGATILRYKKKKKKKEPD
jgi:hypothetical protein